MDDANVFGIIWSREIQRQQELYAESLIAVIKYTNSFEDYCYISNDVINLIYYKESLGWKIDDEKILSIIQKSCKDNSPLFICFNDEQKIAVERMLKKSFLANVCAISARELFC